MPAVTVKEAAAALGHRSPGQLYRWLQDGKLSAFEIDGGDNGRRLELNGLAAHVETIRQRRITNVGPGVRDRPKAPAKPRASAPSEIPDYNDSRARSEFEKANILEMERRQKEGELIERTTWERAYVETVSRVKTKLLGVPSRVKQRVPHLDPEDVAVIDDLLREALEELADGCA